MNYFQTVHRIVMQNAWFIYVLQRTIGVRNAIRSFVSIPRYVIISLGGSRLQNIWPCPWDWIQEAKQARSASSILVSPYDFCCLLTFDMSAQSLTWIQCKTNTLSHQHRENGIQWTQLATAEWFSGVREGILYRKAVVHNLIGSSFSSSTHSSEL